MKNLLIIAILFLVGCGVSFETLTLDDTEVASAEESFRYFKAPNVFKDATDNVWGLEKDECKDFQHVSLDGNSVLQLEWNKTSCDWVGFGIGWNNWQPKDLMTIMESGDLVMDVRAVKERANIPIMVFLLEDYSGTMSAAVSGAYCLEKYPVDENWQEFRMPMKNFDYQTAGVDLTNIKQLVIECQGFGSIMVDNIRIEEHQDRIISGKKAFPPHTVDFNRNVTIFDEEFDKVWGLGDYPNRSFKVVDEQLLLSWDECDECPYHRMGTSWEGWKGVNLQEHFLDLKLVFANAEAELDQGDITVIIENYSGAFQTVQLSKMIDNANADGKIEIPLSDFSEDPAFWSRIKQLRFEFSGKGEMIIDKIEITDGKI